jgi:hypothetical protein
MTPKRIQLSRAKGWRKPEGAVVVARPSRWGNPFRPVLRDGRWIVLDDNDVDYEPYGDSKAAAIRKAVQLFYDDGFYWFGGRFEMMGVDVAAELGGKDLACWCALDAPCHADVLLEIANPGGGLTT